MTHLLSYVPRYLHLVLLFCIVPMLVACNIGGSASPNPSVTQEPSVQATTQPCDAPAPPRDNVRAQADNCGVPALEIVRKGVLPKAPKVGIVTIDLYIEQNFVCLVSVVANVPCLTGDNRPFVSSGQPDPMADSSRNKGHLTLDFTTGQLTLRVNPSCRVVDQPPQKECNAPHPEGNGTQLNVSFDSSNGSVGIELTLLQSDYFSGGACDLYNNFHILPENNTGTFVLTGEGSGFPDLAVIHGGSVVYANQGTHATELCYSLVHKRTYVYPSNPPKNNLRYVNWFDEVKPVELGCEVPRGPGLGVNIDEVEYADVTGTGKEDAFVAASCRSSTSSWPDVLLVFDGASDITHPQLTARLLGYHDGTDERGLQIGDLSGIPHSIIISGQTVTVISYGYVSSDPNCCPSQRVTDTFTWNGSGFTRGARSVVQAKAP